MGRQFSFVHVMVLIKTCFAILIIAILLSCGGKKSDLLLSGVLETDDYDLMAPYAAKLMEIRVKEGDVVRTGDTLAVLDTVVAGAQRRAALSAVKRAQANLDNLQAGSDREKIQAAESRLQNSAAVLEQAERDLKRAEKLHAESLINDQAFENTKLQLQTAQSNKQIATEELADLKRGARTYEIAAAVASLDQAKAELSAADKQLRDAFLVTSVNGVVHLLPFQIGELIPAGKSAATVHAKDNLWIKIYVPEDYLERVSLGDSLSFTVDAYPDKSFPAVVEFISSTAEFTPRNVQTQDERLNLVFAVKLVIVSQHEQLRAGMPADFRL